MQGSGTNARADDINERGSHANDAADIDVQFSRQAGKI
jgi:hypothetical protein